MIKELTIKNFKAFSDTKPIRLGGLTLLTGVNGRGKSSFLQPLLLLSQSLRESEEHTLTNLLTSGRWLDLGNFSDIININAAQNPLVTFSLDTDSKTDHRFDLTYKTNDDLDFGQLCSLKVNGVEQFTESTFWGGVDTTEKKEVLSVPAISGYTSLVSLQRMYYIAADRNCAQNEEAYGSQRQLWPDKNGSNILNIIYAQGEDFQKQVEHELSLIFDGATLQIKQKGETLRLYMDSIDGGQLFTPVNVGFGYSYVLSIIACGLLAKDGEILIIENPEAHLHPSAQAAIMRFLCNTVLVKGVQVFVETHSDHIVNAALIVIKNENIPFSREQLEILFFSRQKGDENQFTIQNLDITNKGRVKNPPRSFCDQYAMDLKTLMGF